MLAAPRDILLVIYARVTLQVTPLNCYSYRSATMGSTRVARLAGT